MTRLSSSPAEDGTPPPAASRRPSAGDCDRPVCPVAWIGDEVAAEFDPFRAQALGRRRVQGRVEAVTPFLHGLVVAGFIVGGHHCTDQVARVRAAR